MIPEWDGEIRHNVKPGLAGYKKYGCRCPYGCAEAGVVIRARKRERDRLLRAAVMAPEEGDAATPPPCHGDDCVCDGCTAEREHRRTDQVVSRKVPVISIDDIVHLRPGFGVRRRIPDFDSSS